MTTPNRRGSGPYLGSSGASGSSGATGPFDHFPTPWNSQWVITPPVDVPNTVDLTAGPPAANWGASGSSGASGAMAFGAGASGSSGSSGSSGLLGSSGNSPWFPWVTVPDGGASGASGGSRPAGVDGLLSINTDRFSDLPNRGQNVVSAVYSDAVPIIGAWEFAGNSLFQGLLGGFTSAENFVETIIKLLTGFDIDLSFLTDGVRVFLEVIQAIFEPIGVIVETLWNVVGEPIFKLIFDVLQSLVETFLDAAETLGIDVKTIFDGVWNILGQLWAFFGDVIEAGWTPLLTTLKWFITTFGEVLLSFIRPIMSILLAFWNGIGANAVASLMSWIISAWNMFGQPVFDFLFSVGKMLFDTFDFLVIDNIIQFFKDLADNNSLFDVIIDVGKFFANVIEDFGTIVGGIPLISTLNQAIDGVIGWIVGLINALTGGFFNTIVQGIQGIVAWILQIPLIGPLISAFIPDTWENALTGQPPSALSDVAQYTSETLNTGSAIPAENIVGQLPGDLIANVGVGSVGESRPNLIIDPGFKSDAAVQVGMGWTWDGEVSHTAGDGGSVKVAGDGGVKQLFANLVAVSPNQELECSAWVKWEKSVFASPTISVGLRGFNGSATVFTQPVVSKSNISYNSSVFQPGSVNGWVNLVGTFTVPVSPHLTHVRLVLSVTGATSGTFVWFDDISLRKMSLIDQVLVSGSSPGSNLADDIENRVGVEQYQALLDRVAKKTGATLADVQATVDDFLDGDSVVSGNQIRAGNIASTFISELGQTWETLQTGIQGPGAPTSNTLSAAFNALDSWRVNFGSNASGVLAVEGRVDQVQGKVDNLSTDLSQWKDYTSKIGTDIRALAIEKGITPTTPETPPGAPAPTFTSAEDFFERTSLGGNWQVDSKPLGAFTGWFGADGKNAYFEVPPITAADGVGAAIYTGSGSITNYQKIKVALGTSINGFNDLIGRATGPTSGIVARFYNNRVIRLFHRSGSWENPWSPSAVFGTFYYTSDFTSGTTLELFIGNKATSNPKVCWVKVGSWISPTADIPDTVFPLLGNRWGWGGGNAVVFGIGFQSGRVDYWGGQDQT